MLRNTGGRRLLLGATRGARFAPHGAGALLAAAACVLTPRAGIAQHAEHARPAQPPAKPAANPTSARGKAGPTQRFVEGETAVELSLTPAAREDSVVYEQEDAVLRLTVTDVKTGKPLSGLELAGWIDRRESAKPTTVEECRPQIARYLRGKLFPEGSLRATAAVNLNSYFVLSLNESPNISVIDPMMGFGRTQLYTTVPLERPGEDWALSNEQDRLYVTMPLANKVAVVNTDNWKVVRNVEAGPVPVRVEFQPGERYLWVTNATSDSAKWAGGVSVIDASTLAVVARIPTGKGPHTVTFSDEGRLAFVANGAEGTVSVIDAQRRVAIKTISTGSRPVDLAYSPVSKALYVAHETDGSIAVVDAGTLAIVRRIATEPGVRAIRFPTGNQPTHHGHGGGEHAAGGQAGVERLGFIVNPRSNRVHILDATRNLILRSAKVGNAPDQVTFTGSFAYIRSTGSAEVAMIPLEAPLAGGSGNHDKFDAGQAAPRTAGPIGIADAMVPAPDMPDALYILNPKERMIYYYHYMEGMPIPSGGLTTYGFQPKAVLVTQRALRETEPGVYSATVKLPHRGDYDVLLVVDKPRVVNCFPVAARGNPASFRGKSTVVIEQVGERRELLVGGDTLRVRLVDALTGRAVAGVSDARLLLSTTSGWQQRVALRPAEGGVYDAVLTVPAPGTYFAAFEIPSLNLGLRDPRHLILQAANKR